MHSYPSPNLKKSPKKNPDTDMRSRMFLSEATKPRAGAGKARWRTRQRKREEETAGKDVGKGRRMAEA